MEDGGGASVSEYDQHDAERRKAPTPEAKVHLAKWSPWIWIVPALAVFIAGFLIVRYGFFGVSDVQPGASLAVLAVSLALFSALALWMLASGYKLRH